MARTKDQAARREQIVQAASRAVVTRAVRGPRIRDVAAEACVSAGSVGYYCPDLDDLLLDVHEQSVDRLYWSRMHSVRMQAPQPQRSSPSWPADCRRGPAIRCAMPSSRCTMRATRHAKHAALMTKLFDGEVSVHVSVLERGEATCELRLAAPGKDNATSAVALEDALGLHTMARNQHLDEGRAVDLLRAYLSQAVGADLTDRAGRDDAGVEMAEHGG